MKVSELDGALLDCWVARAEEKSGRIVESHSQCNADYFELASGVPFRPSTHWAHAGPIIEREIAFLTRHGPTKWSALANGSAPGHGSTPLVAAMRAYVASKFGDEVSDNPE